MNLFKKALFLIVFIIYGCTPYLSVTEVTEKLNVSNEISFDDSARNIVQNTPSAYFRLNQKDKDVVIKEYAQFFRDQSSGTGISMSKIRNLSMSDRLICNSTHYYKIKYDYTRTEITPYLDSIALSLNIQSYGKENVHFNEVSKVLTLNLKEERIAVYDEDKSWKILLVNGVDNDTYYGTGFSKCVQKN